MMPTRSASTSASSRYCVVRNTVTPVVGQAPHLVPQRRAALGIEAGRRLVEEQQPRAVHEREREVEPALHAARVAADLAVGGLGQPTRSSSSSRAVRARLLSSPCSALCSAHVLAAGEVRVERGLLQRGADRAAHLGALLDDVEAGDASRARGRRQQRRQDEHRRRLAGAVGTEEPVDLAGRDLEVDPVDGAHAALEVADEAFDLDAVRGVAHAPLAATEAQAVAGGLDVEASVIGRPT